MHQNGEILTLKNIFCCTGERAEKLEVKPSTKLAFKDGKMEPG